VLTKKRGQGCTRRKSGGRQPVPGQAGDDAIEIELGNPPTGAFRPRTEGSGKRSFLRTMTVGQRRWPTPRAPDTPTNRSVFPAKRGGANLSTVGSNWLWRTVDDCRLLLSTAPDRVDTAAHSSYKPGIPLSDVGLFNRKPPPSTGCKRCSLRIHRQDSTGNDVHRRNYPHDEAAPTEVLSMCRPMFAPYPRYIEGYGRLV
jgi:hypothetical protein